MHLPARIIRRECEHLPGQRPSLSFKEQDRRDRIMDAAQLVMARHGAGAIRLNEFALGLGMAPITIRRHFPDMAYLLAEILTRHLRAVVRAIGAVPANAPDRQAARRAAYLGATRTLGAPTEAHLLLIRDRHLLPPDEAEHIEAHRLCIGDIIAGDDAKPALALLDSPELNLQEVEAALSAIIAAPRPGAATPHEVLPAARTQTQPAPTQHPCPAPPQPDPRDARRPRAGPH